jgi:hypothetical protein
MQIPLGVIFFAYDEFYKHNIDVFIISSKVELDEYIGLERAMFDYNNKGKEAENDEEEEIQTE